jgi:hypothetical protein
MKQLEIARKDANIRHHSVFFFNPLKRKHICFI